MSTPSLWIPSHLKSARKHIRIVFYYNRQQDRVEVGAPDQYPLPPVLARLGYEKVVCETAHEVEIYSEKKRRQDKRDAEMSAEERELAEGPIRDAIRKDLNYKMLTARNQINRDFCKYALMKMDQEDEKRKKEKIESYMHVEAAEQGH
jgi:hypothetical protein